MTLKDQMAADLTETFLNTDDFADDARFVVKGTDLAFDLVVAFGDPQPGFFQIDGGQEDRRPVTVTALQSEVREGIRLLEGVARDPIKGDGLLIAAGAHQGTWIVQTAQPDVGGAIVMTCIYSALYTANAPGAREIR